MAIKFTPDQENAIKARGTVLVAAAAGSGKTAVLAERVVRRVCDPKDSATIDRMLIVTFTNASALEMRVRIGRELDKRSALEPNNSYILKQKLLLKSAKICTIDSFCIDLVKKHFGVVGVSPDFSVASGAQVAIFKERALKSVLDRHFAEPDEGFNILCESFGIYKGEKHLQEAILSVYDFSMCLSRPDSWLDNSVKNYFVDDIKSVSFAEPIYQMALQKLNKSCDSIRFILRESVGTEFEADWHSGFGASLESVEDMISTAESYDWDRLYDMAVLFEKTKVGRIKKGQDVNLHGIMKSVREDIFSNVKAVADLLCGPSKAVLENLKTAGLGVRSLVQIVKEFSTEYFQLLNNNNLLTFSIIEQLALKLLCVDTPDGLVPSELSKDICKQYDEVLVDEYQDNNDLQDSLFFAVSDSGKHLFMVGDVKQCIYAFRNANPDNFLRHKNTYPLYDGQSSQSKVILSSNFRSRGGVCDFVNGICKTLMQKNTCGLDYNDEEKLVLGAEYPENGKIAAKLCLTDTADSDIDRVTADARTVADYISECMNEEPFLRDSDKLRKARYSDFAILLRSPKSRAKFYIDALKAKGIPVVYNSGEFFETPEILTAVSILRIIDNPTQDIPLLSAMTSVVFGFSYDDVAYIKSHYHGKSLYARVLAAFNDGNEKCAQFLKTLEKLRSLSVTLSVDRLISEVYALTHLKEIMSSAENGLQRKNNLSVLQSMASDFVSFSDAGFSGFLRFYDRSEEEGSVGEKTAAKDVNAVKIMSFHGSKGLQFPVCIVAGCGGGFNFMDLRDKLIVNANYGIGLNYVTDSIKHDTIAHKCLKITQQSKLIAEELRLLYVAMTRAEERLMISITNKGIDAHLKKAATSLGLTAQDDGLIPSDAVLSAGGLMPMILSAALLQKGAEKLCDLGEITPFGFDGVGEFELSVSKLASLDIAEDYCEIENQQTTASVNAEGLNALKERFGFVYPYQDEEGIPSKMAVTQLVHGDSAQFAFKSRPRFLSKAGLTPAERGTALHKFMQFSDYSRAETDLEAELDRLYEYEFLSAEEIASIDRSSLKKFFAGGLFHRIKNSLNVMREYKFMVHHPYNGHQTIIQGIADCVFEENGELVILDFKTDDVKDMSVLSERYSQQLQIYKEALESIFQKKVSECVIYSLKLGEEINV